MKKIFICLLLFFSIFSFGTYYNTVSAAGLFDTTPESPYCPAGKSDCGLQKGIDEVKGEIDGLETQKTASQYIQDIVLYVLTFLFLVTVIIIIGAGVMILMSAGNDDRVEKAKKVIINSVIGLIVIFLAYPIANFIIGIFTNASKAP